MLCEECQKEQATVHVTRIVNNHKSEVHLCNQCASEKGEFGVTMDPGFTFHNILAGLVDPEGTLMQTGPRTSASRCSGCGLGLMDFRRMGKVGCGQCYIEFERELEPLLRRIHRSVEHVGRVPHTARDDKHSIRKQLERIRARLNEAVANEEFEEAARLRDEARALERKLEED